MARLKLANRGALAGRLHRLYIKIYNEQGGFQAHPLSFCWLIATSPRFFCCDSFRLAYKCLPQFRNFLIAKVPQIS
jgi:hypothetical protein